MNTTGLVLFARNAPCRDALLAAFAQRQIHKTYHCVVKGRPQPPQATRTAYARKDPQRARVQVLPHPAPEAKEMVTSYQVLSTKGDASLLAVDLHTGRTHQIRAHMAYLGHPLLGDDKYGDRDWNRLHKVSLPRLCAVALRFDLEPDSPYAYLNDLPLQIQPPWTF